MNVFSFRNTVPFLGRLSRHRANIVVLTMLAVGSLASCTTFAQYSKGPMPVGALPPVGITISIAPRPGGIHEVVSDERLSGTVRDVSLVNDPIYGFRLRMADIRGMAIRIQADTLFEGVRPDLATGTLLTIEQTQTKGHRVRFDDERGSVAWFEDGEYVPEMPKKLPFGVAVSPLRSYRSVFATEDLCRWTVIYTHLAVTPTPDGPTTLLAPGEARQFVTPTGTYLFAALDASVPEESDCEQDGEPHVAWFWIRLSGEDAKRLQDLYPPVTTESRDAGSATPSPSQSPPPSG